MEEDIEHRFVEQRQHFDLHFKHIDECFDEQRRRHDLTDKRLDRIEIEIRANSRDMRFFTPAVVAGQIGIALAILIMASKMYFG